MKIWYSVGDHVGRIEYTIADGLCIDRPMEQLIIAEDCARDFFDDTNKNDWPQVVRLYKKETGPEFASFDVGVELSPTFFASRRKP